MIDVLERLDHLRQEVPSLRLYALVDGAACRLHRGDELAEGPGRYPLFRGTADAPLAHAGPWLIDTDTAGPQYIENLAALEVECAAVSWIMALQELTGLAQLLQLNLDMKLPDGRLALVRFWDPRVLFSLAEVLTADQRGDFFGHIYEWHFLRQGHRMWIGRQRAAA